MPDAPFNVARFQLDDGSDGVIVLSGRDNYGVHFTLTWDRGQVADLTQQLLEWLER